MIEFVITKEVADYVEEHKNKDKYSFIYNRNLCVAEGVTWTLEGFSEKESLVLLQNETTRVGFWVPSYLIPQDLVGKLLEELETRRLREDFEKNNEGVDWTSYRLETARQIAITCLNNSFNKELVPDYEKMMEWSVKLTDKLIKELRSFKKE